MILLLLACVDARRPLTFPIRYAELPSATLVVPGGTLQVDAATLQISDLHLQTEPSASTAFWGFPWASSAVAHPGHEFAGSVRGELIGEWDLDLLAPTELGVVDAYEGSIATGSVLLDEAQWVVRGTYTTASGSWPVDLQLTVDGVVTNIPLDLELNADTPPAELVLHLDLAQALSFSSWQDTDADGSITVQDGPFLNTMNFGLTSTSSWVLEETP